MVFSDIRNGEVSDFGDYAWAAVRESVIGAISGAIFGPFGPAATTAGKMTIGEINNGFESVLRQTLNGKKINPLVVLFDAGLGAVTAGVIDSKYGKQIGEAVDDAAPWLKNGMNKMMDCIEDNSNKLANLMGNNNQLVPAVLGVPSNFMNSVDDNVHTPMRLSTSEAGGSGANGNVKATTPEGVGNAYLSAEMEQKILAGERIPGKNGVRGGHSPNVVNDASENFAVEVIHENPDGSKFVQFYKQFSDGSISKLKKSTVFPDSWGDDKIISSIKQIRDTPAVGSRTTDGITTTLHSGNIDGVEIDVIKEGNKITAGYPVGGKPTPGFEPIN